MNILITGGCGFIGNSIIKNLIKNKNNNILNIDKITNVSSPESLKIILQITITILKKMIFVTFQKLLKFLSLLNLILLYMQLLSHMLTIQ